MSTAAPHSNWLVDTGQRITTGQKAVVEVWDLAHLPDKLVISAWARHFRQHYCHDTEIDKLSSGTGFTKKDFLTNVLFPDKSIAPGPSISELSNLEINSSSAATSWVRGSRDEVAKVLEAFPIYFQRVQQQVMSR